MENPLLKYAEAKRNLLDYFNLPAYAINKDFRVFFGIYWNYIAYDDGLYVALHGEAPSDGLKNFNLDSIEIDVVRVYLSDDEKYVAIHIGPEYPDSDIIFYVFEKDKELEMVEDA